MNYFPDVQTPLAAKMVKLASEHAEIGDSVKDVISKMDVEDIRSYISKVDSWVSYYQDMVFTEDEIHSDRIKEIIEPISVIIAIENPDGVIAIVDFFGSLIRLCVILHAEIFSREENRQYPDGKMCDDLADIIIRSDSSMGVIASSYASRIRNIKKDPATNPELN